jgi:hypothetical protein
LSASLLISLLGMLLYFVFWDVSNANNMRWLAGSTYQNLVYPFCIADCQVILSLFWYTVLVYTTF